MISSIGTAAAAALVPRPHEAAPGARPQDDERGRPESAKPGAARPGGGGPAGPLLDPSTVAALQEHGQGEEARQGAGEGKSAADAAAAPTEPAAGPAANLSAEEKREVQELKRADAEVRRHEAAHANTGGAFAGAPSYTYQTGPDGKRYAVGGEVSIDTAPVAGDPEATIAKMRTVQRAANAPADPSGQDRAVAAAAARAESQARAELAAERREERREADGGEADGGPGGVNQIATQHYSTAASLVGEGDDNQLGANDSNRLGPFQTTGTATPRIERLA